MNRRLTRRAVVAQLACAGRALPQVVAGEPLRVLRPGHPRLIAIETDIERARILIRENQPARKIYNDLVKDAEKMLTAPTAEYRVIGPRLLQQCQRVLERVYTLSLLYRLDGKTAYLDRAIKELRAAAQFRDWNPSHFLDTAEMTHAFAIGLDWLHAGLAEADRALLTQAIVQKGLEPGLQAYQSQALWVRQSSNWNLVCNSGLALGALAVLDIEKEKGAAIMRHVVESIPRGMAAYGADGGWPEGPGYWDYATRYAVYLLSALETAYESDLGLGNAPGFAKAGRFRIYFSSPAGKTFNFADAHEELTEEPAMFWLAKRFSQPVYAWQQQRLVERSSHAEPLDLIWYARDAKGPQPPQWPLDAVFPSVQCAFFRSSWDDPNGLFLAVKGGDNRASHAHLDLGSFVFDAGGVRWAKDLGPDDYNLLDYFGRNRWSYYRTRTESHNTLLIDGENQDSKAAAAIIHHEFGPDLSWVQIDLSRAYPAKLKTWQRRIGLAARQAVLIEDTVQADQPVEVLWGMITDAEITISGQTAELTKEGWTLSAEIRTPRHAVFDIEPAKPPSPQAQNTGIRKLVARIGERVTEVDLSVVLTPHRSGQPKPKTTAKFPA